VIRANVIGLADFAAALVVDLTTPEGLLHIFATDAPDIINA
jgi:hypothetical protein